MIVLRCWDANSVRRSHNEDVDDAAEMGAGGIDGSPDISVCGRRCNAGNKRQERKGGWRSKSRNFQMTGLSISESCILIETGMTSLEGRIEVGKFIALNM